MNTSLSTSSDYKLITFHPTYENVYALLAEILLYVFDGSGKLIESQAIRRDKVTVAMPEAALAGAKIALGPPVELGKGEALTLTEARSHYLFEAELQCDHEQTTYILPPVPEDVWRWWLVHSLWKNVRKPAVKKTGLLNW
jgi:hypothetical protein